MRYIANLVKEDEYEITHITEMETLNGGKVEVIKGKNVLAKGKLEKAITDYEEETKLINETRELEINDLKEILESMNK